jgi:hypothetical protein
MGSLENLKEQGCQEMDVQTSLRSTAARVDVGGSFSGSALMVAPGVALTCSHVVGTKRSAILYWADGEGVVHREKATVRRVPALKDNPYPALHPYPDLAILQSSLVDHPCVRFCLRIEPPPNADVHGAGYSEQLGAAQFEAFSAKVDAWVGPPGKRLLKLKDTDIVEGQSGSAIGIPSGSLTIAILTATKGPETVIGGYATPLIDVAPGIANLLELNDEYHRSNGNPYRTEGESGLLDTVLDLLPQLSALELETLAKRITDHSG